MIAWFMTSLLEKSLTDMLEQKRPQWFKSLGQSYPKRGSPIPLKSHLPGVSAFDYGELCRIASSAQWKTKGSSKLPISQKTQFPTLTYYPTPA